MHPIHITSCTELYHVPVYWKTYGNINSYLYVTRKAEECCSAPSTWKTESGGWTITTVPNYTKDYSDDSKRSFSKEEFERILITTTLKVIKTETTDPMQRLISIFLKGQTKQDNNFKGQFHDLVEEARNLRRTYGIQAFDHWAKCLKWEE